MTNSYLSKLFRLWSAAQKGDSPANRIEGDASRRTCQRQNLAERLGYGKSERLLIVHADDLGITHSVNAAVFRGFQCGLINSGSVMACCPWFAEVVAYARSHPQLDLGIHLTLTSERSHCRWGPTAPTNDVSSLIDNLGYFHQTWTRKTRINPYELEIELRAQIERAYAAGLQPTHLDSHQYRLQQSGPDLFLILLKLGRQYRLPVFVARNWFEQWPYLQRSISDEEVVIDHTVTIDTGIKATEWPEFYRNALENMPPGVTTFIIHPGLDDPELQAFSADRPAFGALWRQRDFDFFTSLEFRNLLEKHNIRLINWRQITTRLQQR